MRHLISALAFICVGTAAASAQTPAAHRFVQVAPGVYSAVGNGTIETR